MSNLSEDDHYDNVMFFEAFDRLSDEYNNIKLFVTGEQKYIKRILSNYNFGDKVIYKGWLDFHVYNFFLSSCNIFVLPLRNNNRNAGRWPNKISDYFTLERPVFTNATGDLTTLFSKTI